MINIFVHLTSSRNEKDIQSYCYLPLCLSVCLLACLWQSVRCIKAWKSVHTHKSMINVEIGISVPHEGSSILHKLCWNKDNINLHPEFNAPRRGTEARQLLLLSGIAVHYSSDLTQPNISGNAFTNRQTEESVKRVDRSCLAHHKLNSHKYKVLRTLYYTWRASFRTQPTVYLTQAFPGVDDAIFSLEWTQWTREWTRGQTTTGLVTHYSNGTLYRYTSPTAK